jgi:tetratricopeptide (TPR) repeat protein
VDQARRFPEIYPFLVSIQADSASYEGRYQEAQRLADIAGSLMKEGGDDESAAGCWAEAALRDAKVGYTKESLHNLAKALKLNRNDETLSLAALTMARVGHLNEATRLAEKLDKQNPANTLLQRYWLPTVRAEVALQQGHPAIAIRLLSITEPFEMGLPDGLNNAVLYPAYVRGQAFLAMGDGLASVKEFDKLLNHPDLVLNYPLGALPNWGRLVLWRVSISRSRRTKAITSFYICGRMRTRISLSLRVRLRKTRNS